MNKFEEIKFNMAIKMAMKWLVIALKDDKKTSEKAEYIGKHIPKALKDFNKTLEKQKTFNNKNALLEAEWIEERLSNLSSTVRKMDSAPAAINEFHGIVIDMKIYAEQYAR